MPLTRANVTVASRIMLPTYVAFFITVGLTYILTPLPELLAAPGLDAADHVFPLRGWGWLFLAAAALMAAALIRGRREWFTAALLFCAFSMGVFAVVLMESGVSAWIHQTQFPDWLLITSPALQFLLEVGPSEGPSLAAWTWPALAVAACLASYRSLAAGEQ